MFGFADRGNINNANPVWVMFWYNCIDTFVNGKGTKTNKRLLMRLKRWKITQTGTLTGLKIQGELLHLTVKRATKWNDPQALLIQYLLRNQWTSRGGQILQNLDALRAIFVWPRTMVSVSVCYLFYQTMDEKTQNMASSFSRQTKSYYGECIVCLANHAAVWRQSQVSGWFLESSRAWSFFTRAFT